MEWGEFEALICNVWVAASVKENILSEFGLSDSSVGFVDKVEIQRIRPSAAQPAVDPARDNASFKNIDCAECKTERVSFLQPTKLRSSCNLTFRCQRSVPSVRARCVTGFATMESVLLVQIANSYIQLELRRSSVIFLQIRL